MLDEEEGEKNKNKTNIENCFGNMFQLYWINDTNAYNLKKKNRLIFLLFQKAISNVSEKNLNNVRSMDSEEINQTKSRTAIN